MATDKQKAFVAHYLSNGLNATQAAKSAGYKGSYQTLRVIGHENLTKPNIKSEIDSHLQKSAMARDEVLHRIGEQARGNMGDFVRLEQRVRPKYTLQTDDDEISFKEEAEHYELMELDLRAAKDSGRLGLVKKIKFDKDGGVSFELYSAQVALDMLAKAHGLYSDAQSGDDGDFDDYLHKLPRERDHD